MQRDGQVFTSDSVMIYLDPGQTRRNAYNFEIGASGGRTDQLELNNTEELTEWDTIWDARARIVEDGWVAEFAIPFKSLSYEPAQTTWGFDVARRIYHKNERVHWSGFNPALDFTDVSQTGDLVGIENVSQGIGLDVQVYGALAPKHDWQLEGDGAGLSFTAGGNAFYKVTPALTNTLTVNPDFSDAPLDIRQVNTTRFSLFTPETRDFFLQDVAAFEFGGRSFGRNSQDRVSNNGRPFFSRNIGLVQGRPVSLIVGDKLSGQFAGFDVGAFSVLTDKTPAGEDGQILSVARVTHPIFAESKFGFVFTNGDPTGLTDNTVAGADFQYRNSNFFGDKVLQADVLLHEELLEHGRRRRIGGVLAQLPQRALVRRFPVQADRREFHARARLRQPHRDPAICGDGRASDALPEHLSQHARIRHQFRIRHRSERRAGIARQRRFRDARGPGSATRSRCD